MASRFETRYCSNRGTRGYDYWLAANLLEFCSDAYDCNLWNNDNEKVHLPGYRVDAMTDAVIRYIDDVNKQDKPFFLFTSYLEPHHQNHVDDYPPPDGYREQYTGKWIPPDLQQLGGSSGQHLGGYLGMIKRLDEALGRIRDALKSLQIDQKRSFSTQLTTGAISRRVTLNTSVRSMSLQFVSLPLFAVLALMEVDAVRRSPALWTLCPLCSTLAVSNRPMKCLGVR